MTFSTHAMIVSHHVFIVKNFVSVPLHLRWTYLKQSLFLNSCYDCIIVTIYCQIFITTYKNTFNFSSMLAQRTFRHCQVTEEITRSNCEVCPSKMFIYMVEALGLEPRTLGLKVRCSKPTELYFHVLTICKHTK